MKKINRKFQETSPVVFDTRFFNLNAKNNKARKMKDFVTYLTRKEAIDGQFLDYMDARHGSTGAFDLKGNDLNQTQLNDLKAKLNQHRGLVWTSVISLRTDFALEHEFTFQQKAKQIIKKSFNSFLVANNLYPQTMETMFAFHTNTDNPHIHCLFFEKIPARNKGVLSPTSFRNLEKEFALHLQADLLEYELSPYEQKHKLKFEQHLQQFLEEQQIFQQTEYFAMSQENVEKLTLEQKEKYLHYCYNYEAPKIQQEQFLDQQFLKPLETKFTKEFQEQEAKLIFAEKIKYLEELLTEKYEVPSQEVSQEINEIKSANPKQPSEQLELIFEYASQYIDDSETIDNIKNHLNELEAKISLSDKQMQDQINEKLAELKPQIETKFQEQLIQNQAQILKPQQLKKGQKLELDFQPFKQRPLQKVLKLSHKFQMKVFSQALKQHYKLEQLRIQQQALKYKHDYAYKFERKYEQGLTYEMH